MKERYCRFGVLALFASANKCFKFITRCLGLLTLLGLLGTLPVRAQAPGQAWTTNVGATLFAVDTQSNVYAYVGGAVEVLNSAGALIQSNNICPVAGIPQRDVSGNYYFAGNFVGNQNFGGITLTDAWLTVPLCYLAKYTSAGSLLWAVPFGQSNYNNKVDDMAINPDGSLTIGYDYAFIPQLTQFSPDGAQLWETNIFPAQYTTGALKVGSFAGNRGAYLLYKQDETLIGGFYDSSGRLTTFTSPPYPLLIWTNYSSWNAKPVLGTHNDVYLAIVSYTPSVSTVPVLQDDQAGGTVLSSAPIGPNEQWVLAGDGAGNLYLADGNADLSDYLANGTLIWSTNYGSAVSVMLVDSNGSRYISKTDGSIAKLLPDSVPAPVITNAPQGGTIFAGTNFTFSAGASGYAPLNYQWVYQSNALAPPTLLGGATNSTLMLTNVTDGQSGLYSVAISNVAGSITSTPVALRVKSVELFFGNEMLTGGPYYFATGTPPTLTVKSAFTNGEIYYSLDGSTPDFTSVPYTGPFVLSNSATVNAIGYSADFSQSELADTVIATIPPQYTISVFTAGGGTIDLFPLGGNFTNTNISYASNITVTATANPASGFSFLYWQGASSSTNPTITLPSNQNVSLTAVFGTSLSTTVAGYGQVLLAPPGGVYPYGSIVRLEALPQPGNYFGAWGNAASGSVSPLYITLTNPTPTVSSIFAAIPANKSALTVLVTGQGRVGQNPAGNAFATNQSVTLTATPNAGQSFLGWTGSATSTQNPLAVAMTQSRVITAHFTGQSVVLSTAGANGFSSQGFQFSVTGDPLSVYEIQTSSNLLSWQYADIVTNSTGTMQLTYPAAAGAKAAFYRVVVVPQ